MNIIGNERAFITLSELGSFTPQMIFVISRNEKPTDFRQFWMELSSELERNKEREREREREEKKSIFIAVK